MLRLGLENRQVKSLTHQHLLRSMDALMDSQDAVDDVVAKLLRPLVDQDLSMAFYDMTTIRAEGLTTMEGDVRKFGMPKEGLIARQFMLGVVQTSEGLPIYHEVFDGNTAQTKTLLPILKKVMDRFPNLRRLVLVADRGLWKLEIWSPCRQSVYARPKVRPRVRARPWNSSSPYQAGVITSLPICCSHYRHSAPRPPPRSQAKWPGAVCAWWWRTTRRSRCSSIKSAKPP